MDGEKKGTLNEWCLRFFRYGPAFPEPTAAATAAGRSATAAGCAGATATVCVSAGDWNFGRRIPDVRVSDSEQRGGRKGDPP